MIMSGSETDIFLRIRVPLNPKNNHMEVRQKQFVVYAEVKPQQRSAGEQEYRAQPFQKQNRASSLGRSKYMKKPTQIQSKALAHHLKKTHMDGVPKTNVQLIEEETKLPPGVSHEEVENPNALKNLVSYEYCTYVIGQAREQITKQCSSGNPVDPKVSQLMMEATKIRAGIEKQVDAETLSMQDYKARLEGQVQHDRTLLGFLEEKEMTSKAQIVKKRIEIIEQELQE